MFAPAQLSCQCVKLLHVDAHCQPARWPHARGSVGAGAAAAAAVLPRCAHPSQRPAAACYLTLPSLGLQVPTSRICHQHQAALHHDEARALPRVGRTAAVQPAVRHAVGLSRRAYRRRHVGHPGPHVLAVAPPVPARVRVEESGRGGRMYPDLGGRRLQEPAAHQPQDCSHRSRPTSFLQERSGRHAGRPQPRSRPRHRHRLRQLPAGCQNGCHHHAVAYWGAGDAWHGEAGGHAGSCPSRRRPTCCTSRCRARWVPRPPEPGSTPVHTPGQPCLGVTSCNTSASPSDLPQPRSPAPQHEHAPYQEARALQAPSPCLRSPRGSPPPKNDAVRPAVDGKLVAGWAELGAPVFVAAVPCDEADDQGAAQARGCGEVEGQAARVIAGVKGAAVKRRQRQQAQALRLRGSGGGGGGGAAAAAAGGGGTVAGAGGCTAAVPQAQAGHPGTGPSSRLQGEGALLSGSSGACRGPTSVSQRPTPRLQQGGAQHPWACLVPPAAGSDAGGTDPAQQAQLAV